MAQSTEKSKQLGELVRQAEASRLRLSETHARIRKALDLPSRIKASVADGPAKWLGGSLVAGIATSFLFRSRKKKVSARVKAVKKERNFLLGSLTLLFALSKPVAKIYASKLLKDYLTRRFVSGAHGRAGSLHVPPR
jgi:hypothetical protein